MKKLLFFIAAIFVFTNSYSQNEKKPKYIFLFIGDGMGMVQTQLADAYLRATENDSLNFMYFPNKAYQNTYSLSSYITCSAASGTAMACGQKTMAERIGVDKDKRPLTSIAYEAKKQGMKVGILTTVSLDHATPAAFYAHNESRHNYHEIAMDMPKSGFDYFAGGRFVKPEQNRESVITTLKDSDYTIVTSSDSLPMLTQKNNKVCVLAPNSRIDYRIDNPQNPFALSALTETAIRTLDNPKGFFMMVEGGQVDWACHSNDAATAIHEVIDLSNAIKKALEFYQKHPNETLIVVTADHETGGLALGSQLCPYYSNIGLLKNQRISHAELESVLRKAIEKQGKNFTFENCLALMSTYFNGNPENPFTLNAYDSLQLKKAYDFLMTPDKNIANEEVKLMYNSSVEAATYAPQDRCMALIITMNKLIASKAGVAWTTFAHTGNQVGVSAIGAGSCSFRGVIDNTEIHHKLKELIE